MTTFLLSAALVLAAPVPLDRQADAEFEKKVAAARDKAIKYLKEKQEKDGSWPGSKSLIGFEDAQASLVALGLLEAGVPANDPVVVKAVEYLLTTNPDKTYSVSLRLQVLARTDAKKYAKEVQTGADLLVKTAVLKNDKLRGWSYPGNDLTDGSNTHFAVMGLHAAAQAGAKVDADIWRQVRDLYTDAQHKTGGWGYTNTGTDRPSQNMTCAGLLGLAVAAKHDKNAKGPAPAFEKGMAVLLAGDLKGEVKSVTYGWFTTAELGRALGTTEFKAGKVTRDWYRDGAEKVMKEQREDGSFALTAEGQGIDKGYPVVTTAFGLYLLGPPRR